MSNALVGVYTSRLSSSLKTTSKFTYFYLLSKIVSGLLRHRCHSSYFISIRWYHLFKTRISEPPYTHFYCFLPYNTMTASLPHRIVMKTSNTTQHNTTRNASLTMGINGLERNGITAGGMESGDKEYITASSPKICGYKVSE